VVTLQVVETVSAENLDRVRAVRNFQQSRPVSEAGTSICESSVCDGNASGGVRALTQIGGEVNAGAIAGLLVALQMQM